MSETDVGEVNLHRKTFRKGEKQYDGLQNAGERSVRSAKNGVYSLLALGGGGCFADQRRQNLPWLQHRKFHLYADGMRRKDGVFQSRSEGERNFAAIAIVGNDEKTPVGQGDFCPPCGVCRQVMTEFCGGDFEIVLAKDYDDYKVYALSQLMPLVSLPLSK